MLRVVFVLSVLSAACGKSAPSVEPDGGHGADADPGPDLTAPTLVAVTPATGSEAWLHEPIRFELSERVTLAHATVTATLAGVPVGATVAVDDAGTAVAVTIDPAARGLGALSVSVTGDIADLAGNAFTGTLPAVEVALSPWRRPAVDRGLATSAPVIAVSDAGDVLAAWTVDPPGMRAVAVSLYEHGAWHALGDLLGTADTSSPAVAFDASHRPVVAWIEDGTARVERWTGGSWQALPSPGAGTFVMLATPPAGDQLTCGVIGSAAAVRVLDGASWQPLGADLALASPVVGEPALAVGAVGTAAIGWIDADQALRVFRYAGAWTPIAPITLAPSPTGVDHLSLAARDGTIAVAWDELASSFGVLAAKVTGAETTWTRLGHLLDVDAAGDATSPAIAIDESGAPVVAWQENIETVERGVIASWNGTAWTIVGGPTWSTGSDAPIGVHLALHAGQAPVVGWTAGGAVGVALHNGPRVAAPGLTARLPLTGCAFSPANPPQHLLDTGCFTLAAPGKPVPHAGLVPYDIVVELWSDAAKKRRWIALPAGASMTTSSTGAWAAPAGTFILKEFALESTPGHHDTRHAVETRVLYRDASGWQGFTYMWRPDGSDADLLTDGQQTYDWPMDDGTTHRHYYPSRSQCLSCHESSYGPLLGLRPQQLTRWFDYGGVIADQLTTLAQLGVGPNASVTAFPSPHDPSQGVYDRMRGYMAANCAHCHNPDHIAIKDLRFTTPLASTRLCEVIVPGSPASSRVYQLVNQRPGMPALGSLMVDPLPVSLIGTWITNLTSCP